MKKQKKIRKHSQVYEVFMRLKRNKAAVLGLIIFLLEILLAIFAPLLTSYDYSAMDFANMLQKPSVQHWMGTDDLGRDIFTRILYGGRYSISLGVSAVLVALAIGVVFGAIAGYFGGAIDNIIMRFLDILHAIPSVLLCIVISTALGSGMINTVLALSVARIPSMARMLRASILNIRKMEYLESAEAINCSKVRIIFSHILPNSFSPLIVSSTMGVAGTILTAATLSFMGLGIQPPTPEWGAMLSGCRTYIRQYPHTVIFPGLAIAVTVLSLNLMGDGLRDALDPKLKD